MEGLNLAMNMAKSKSVLTGIHLPRGPSLTHLLYADDAIFVGEWNSSCIKNLSTILKCFHISSGLKVNFTKSRLFGVNTSDIDLHHMASILGCADGSFPFSYLGVPVGANMGLIKNWKPIIDKFQSRLSSWKAHTLSFGGRLTLIKSVLNSLPTYYMSLFKAPQGVIDTLEKIRRKFLWGGGEGKSKIHWVDWSTVTAPIEDGGLGINSLKAQNIALLIKWWWKLMNDDGSLWKNVIVSIHNLGDKPASYIARKSSNGVWCNIFKAVKYLEEVNMNINDIFSLIPGSSVKILFWKDIWCGDTPFEQKFKHLYKLESFKSVGLTDRLSENGFNWRWKNEPSSPTELQDLLNLYRELEILSSIDTSKFGFRYNLSTTGEYLVSSMRRMIDSKLNPYKGQTISWFHLTPLKVRCFVWRALLQRIPVIELLKSRGINTSGACVLCNTEPETVNHLFLHCVYAKEVMSWIFRWCGLSPRNFSTIKEFIDFSAEWGNNPRRKHVGNMVMYCFLWCVWLARNDAVFKKISVAPAKTADNIITLSHSWYNNRSKDYGGSWIDWSCSPFSHL